MRTCCGVIWERPWDTQTCLYPRRRAQKPRTTGCLQQTPRLAFPDPGPGPGPPGIDWKCRFWFYSPEWGLRFCLSKNPPVETVDYTWSSNAVGRCWKNQENQQGAASDKRREENKWEVWTKQENDWEKEEGEEPGEESPDGCAGLWESLCPPTPPARWDHLGAPKLNDACVPHSEILI